jgi:hypothetical protein
VSTLGRALGASFVCTAHNEGKASRSAFDNDGDVASKYGTCTTFALSHGGSETSPLLLPALDRAIAVPVLLYGKVEGSVGSCLEKCGAERPNVLLMADCLQSAGPAACRWAAAKLCNKERRSLLSSCAMVSTRHEQQDSHRNK